MGRQTTFQLPSVKYNENPFDPSRIVPYAQRRYRSVAFIRWTVGTGLPLKIFGVRISFQNTRNHSLWSVASNRLGQLTGKVSDLVYWVR